MYGHPDHIQVYRVGVRAAELAGTPRVYMNTINRDHIEAVVRRSWRRRAARCPSDLDPDDLDSLGVPEERITTTVDVRPWLARKRAAMAAHASQISETSFFLAMAPEHVRERLRPGVVHPLRRRAGPGRDRPVRRPLMTAGGRPHGAGRGW